MAGQTVQTVAVQFNQIPKDSILREKIKPLGPKDKVRYRLKGSVDPTKPGKFFGASKFIPSTDTVVDPKTGDVYDIAYIEKVGQGGVPEFGDIYFEEEERFSKVLRGNSAKDVRLYEYLELSNYVDGNEDRDSSRAMLERVVDGMDERTKRDTRRKKADAVKVAEAFTDEEVLNFIRANRLPDPGEAEARRWKIEEYAEKNPDAFAKAPTIDFTALYDDIDTLKKAKALVWNSTTRTWLTFDGKEILPVKKGFGVSHKDELARFLMQKEGTSWLSWLKEELKK
jgi:hypothetical protein